jgi:hypothetical protein
VFYLGKPFQPSLMFDGKAYPIEAPLNCSTLGWAPQTLDKAGNASQGQTLWLFTVVNYSCKKFNNSGSWPYFPLEKFSVRKLNQNPINPSRPILHFGRTLRFPERRMSQRKKNGKYDVSLLLIHANDDGIIKLTGWVRSHKTSHCLIITHD